MFFFVALLTVAVANAANIYDRKAKSTSPETYWWDNANCGKSKYPDAGAHAYSTYVVGGQEARPHEFPWIVSMQRRATQSHFCGGSLISPWWVLTAAHCCDGEVATSLQIRAGAHTRSSNTENQQIIDVALYQMHEGFNSVSLDNDICLMKLVAPATFNENVTAVCEPEAADTSAYFDTEQQIMGWGSQRYGGPCCPDTLLWTWVWMTNDTECKRNYKTATDAMVCAGEGDYTQRDTCQGDSGGPMSVKRANGQFELTGAVSWGYQCAAGKPGVYTDVTFERQWVYDTMAKYP